MNRRFFRFSGVLLVGAALAACGRGAEQGGATSGGASVIKIDGSSTVFPISEAVAEEFQREHRDVRVTVGISGTGGGFQKFCRGETDISDASRPIKPTELGQCSNNQVAFIELPIAYDGLVVVINPKNTWVDHLTTDELKRLWAPEAQGRITRWSQIRTGWPDREIHLFGPGVDSGTYDYFTEAIVGKEGASRGDYTSSEDDNVLVQGIAGDELALGFFGIAYFESNQKRLKAVPIDDGKEGNGSGPVLASAETVKNATYQPLSRPLFLYISQKAAARPEVRQMTEYFLGKGEALVREVGYVPLGADGYGLAKKHFTDGVTGSVFAKGGSQVGLTIEQLLARER
jgi:phosphate transport system substrate-binding protein